MNLYNPVVLFGAPVLAALAAVGIARPLLGLLIFMVLHFVEPGELLPALGPLRLEFFYGLILVITVLLRQPASPSESVFSNRVLRGAFAVVAVAALTIPFSIWRGGAVTATIILVKCITLVFLIVSVVDTPQRLKSLVWLFVGLLSWFVGSSLFAYVHSEISLQEGLDRARGINSMAGNPNALAGLILALLPFLIVAFQETRSVLVRLVLLLCAGASLISLVLSGSRMPMIALVVLAIYYVWRSSHKALTVAFCGVILFTMWAKMPLAYRQRYLTVESYAEGGKLDASNQLRLHIWEVGLQMIRDHPILGVGIGQFNTAYGTIYATRAHQAWMDPHNLLLEVWCEMGIVGLIVFGYFVIQIFKQVGSVPRVDDYSPLGLTYRMSVACGAMLLGLVIMSSISHLLLRPYWYVLGGVVAANWRVAQASLRKWPTVEAEKVGDHEEEQVELAADRLEGGTDGWDFPVPSI